MKAIVCKTWGDPSSVVLENVNLSVPAEGEVRIAVHAVGLNPADISVISGKFQLPPTLPFSPGFEAAGEIIESKSTNLPPRTRVLVSLPYLRDDHPHFCTFAYRTSLREQ